MTRILSRCPIAVQTMVVKRHRAPSQFHASGLELFTLKEPTLNDGACQGAGQLLLSLTEESVSPEKKPGSLSIDPVSR